MEDEREGREGRRRGRRKSRKRRRRRRRIAVEKNFGREWECYKSKSPHFETASRSLAKVYLAHPITE